MTYKDGKCPTCGSDWLVEEKKGFRPKVGHFLFGGAGLIVAAIEGNQTHFVCKECGQTWEKDKYAEAKRLEAALRKNDWRKICIS